MKEQLLRASGKGTKILLDKIPPNLLRAPGVYEIWMKQPNPDTPLLLKVGRSRDLSRRLRDHRASGGLYGPNGLRNDQIPRNVQPTDVRSKKSILAKHLFFDRQLARSQYDLATQSGRQHFLEECCEVYYCNFGYEEAVAWEKHIENSYSSEIRYMRRVRTFP